MTLVGRSLRNLATSLAIDAIFGKEKMVKNSLSGRRNTGIEAQLFKDFGEIPSSSHDSS